MHKRENKIHRRKVKICTPEVVQLHRWAIFEAGTPGYRALLNTLYFIGLAVISHRPAGVRFSYRLYEKKHKDSRLCK